MLLDLSRIIAVPGGVVPFETSLDLHTMQFGSCCPVTEPVQAKGSVRNTAGVLELTGTVWTTLHGVCDRCAAAFARPVEYPIEAVLVTSMESDEFENPWVFELVEDRADLDDILTTAFVLNMDQKLLCREDCKGLCFRCGKNLNEGPCDCRASRIPDLLSCSSCWTGKSRQCAEKAFRSRRCTENGSTEEKSFPRKKR